jgi:hypothetical protein
MEKRVVDIGIEYDREIGAEGSHHGVICMWALWSHTCIAIDELLRLLCASQHHHLCTPPSAPQIPHQDLIISLIGMPVLQSFSIVI